MRKDLRSFKIEEKTWYSTDRIGGAGGRSARMEDVMERRFEKKEQRKTRKAAAQPKTNMPIKCDTYQWRQQDITRHNKCKAHVPEDK